MCSGQPGERLQITGSLLWSYTPHPPVSASAAGIPDEIDLSIKNPFLVVALALPPAVTLVVDVKKLNLVAS